MTVDEKTVALMSTQAYLHAGGDLQRALEAVCFGLLAATLLKLVWETLEG